MGKQDLINQLSKDRKRWPAEARICEHIWSITHKLRDSGLMEDFLEDKISGEDFDILLHEHDNSNTLQDIINLQHECSNMNWELTTEGRIYPSPAYINILSNLGTVLAVECPWWERYETITRTMGVECVLSIRTAESLFKRDASSDKIKKLLIDLSTQKI